MTALDIAIQNALAEEGRSKEANKAYLEFIKANFLIPIEKQITGTDKKPPEAEPKVLYLEENGHVFLPVFSNSVCFDAWAKDIQHQIAILKLSGVDLLKGLGEQVIVSLNIGSPHYKEFNPSELARMRSLVLKFSLGENKAH